MSDTLPISAFIICLNEEARIGATLKSLKGLVEEIVVVDSGSIDGTKDVAASFGAKVMHHDWPGYGQQKRFAEEQCTHDWVLNLDADEVLSDWLIDEIRNTWAKHTELDGYEFSIRDCVSGESRPRPFAHTTRAVRLYDKSKGRYVDSLVHDRVKFESDTPRIHTLKAPVWHYSVTSIEQVIAKLNRYSTLQAEDMHQRGKFPKWAGLRLVFEFPVFFLKSYFLRGDVLRGRKGFVNSMIHAFSRFARIAKAIEKKEG